MLTILIHVAQQIAFQKGRPTLTSHQQCIRAPLVHSLRTCHLPEFLGLCGTCPDLLTWFPGALPSPRAGTVPAFSHSVTGTWHALGSQCMLLVLSPWLFPAPLQGCRHRLPTSASTARALHRVEHMCSPGPWHHPDILFISQLARLCGTGVSCRGSEEVHLGAHVLHCDPHRFWLEWKHSSSAQYLPFRYQLRVMTMLSKSR